MCLIIKKPFIAKKDISVYKIGKNIYGKLCTPFQRITIPFNELYVDPFFSTEIKDCNHYPWHTVGRGCIHACINISTAALYCRKYFIESEIYKAIIPKGSVDFYGEDYEICANQMIILNPEQSGYSEICKEYNLN